MKAKILFISFLLFAVVSNTCAQNTSQLSRTVSDLANDAALKHANLSVCVYNMDKKTCVYSYNSQLSMAPASLAKLFTTACGFDKLGSDFRFRTTLAYSGNIDNSGTLRGDLYIIGGGDPLLGSYRYRQTVPDSIFAMWHRAVSAAGIRAVDGRVCYDASIFDESPIHDSWQWGDIGNYYGSGVSGLNFHENMFFIYFTPGPKVGAPTTISRIAPAGITLRTVNEVTTGPARSGDQVVVYGDPSSTMRVCHGTMPIDARDFSVRASLPKPGQACADLFTVYLRNHKVSVSGAATKAFERPANLVTLIDYTSPTYYVIAQYTNMTSNNTYAEAIFKYLGYRISGIGSHTHGAKVVGDFLKGLNLSQEGVRLEDGCGLSPLNRITTDYMCRFLMALKDKPFYDDFVKSMALAGSNGTVRNMLTGLPSNVSVRMKSGSLDGVRSFAGYVTTAKNEHYSFAVICSDYTCSGSQMRTKLEKVIMKIATME